MRKKGSKRGVIAFAADTGSALFPATRVGNKTGKIILSVLLLLTAVTWLHAQTEFPSGDFWSLGAGAGMSDILVEGSSFQFILEPRLWLSPPLMVGSKLGVNYSTDEILTFEGQVYLRWNFLRLGKNPEKTTDIFLQGGMGMVAAYKGTDSPVSDVTMTRGSLMFDAAAGVTVPLSKRWYIEPSVRGGYPHLFGGALMAGYKFPLPQKTKYQQLPSRTEFVEVIRRLPSNEIIKRIMITAVEFVLFGPDIGNYNVGIDHDAAALNELVLNNTANMLKENSNYRVRIEGHANPVTDDPDEADELMSLSSIRANEVADQLRARDIDEEQMVIIAFGGTRTVTREFDIRNRNRRVELTVIHVDENE
ncbi:MAG: OmpA family protein [Treponema sp.]|nr:OmpA family protein [Treponema sp.]